jgi:hypothetical protein
LSNINNNFKVLFQSILKLREEVWNSYAKETLIANVIDKKEISLIFYLKNKLSDEFKDDNILNQIFLKQNTLNFNFIQTQVNNLNNIQLLDRAKELSGKLERLTKKHSPDKVIDIDNQSKET